MKVVFENVSLLEELEDEDLENLDNRFVQLGNELLRQGYTNAQIIHAAITFATAAIEGAMDYGWHDDSYPDCEKSQD